MEDYQRQFEQRALKNVRALVDKLKRSDQGDMSFRAALILVGVVVGGVLILGGAAMASSWFEARNAKSRACLIDAQAARGGEIWRRLREQHPTLSSRQIDDLMKVERPRILELAKADCGSGLK